MTKNSKVIYTCITGGYDNLQQPLSVSDEWDYVCFTDNPRPQQQQGVWRLLPVPWTSGDPSRLSRYVKMLPHLVLPQYDTSIYIDANIRIVSDEFYRNADRLSESRTLVAQAPNPRHDCIYEEIKAVLAADKDKAGPMVRQYRYLRKNGFPAGYGLYENGLLLRRHNEPLVRSMDERWWQLYMSQSRRDQLTLCYVYWNHGFRPSLIFGPDINIRNCPWLDYRDHSQITRFMYRIRKIRGLISLFIYRLAIKV